MADESTVRRISPILATDNVEATLRFYREVLGFTAVLETPEYLILERDGLTIHFQAAASEEVMRYMRTNAEFYLEVKGVNALWKHVKSFSDRYQIRDLFDREYGMTEFHIKDPNGCLIFVGQRTAQI